MLVHRSAVGTAVSVVMLVILLALAVGAYYFVSNPGPGNPTNSDGTQSSSSSTFFSSSSTSSGTSRVESSTASASSRTTSQASTTHSASSTSATSTAESTSVTSSCTGTTTTNQSTSQQIVYYIAPMLQSISSMSVSYNGTSQEHGTSQPFSLAATYAVLDSWSSGGATTYKIFVESTSGGDTTNSTIWVKSDGTVVAVYTGGQNFTSSSVLSPSILFYGAMAPFLAEASYQGRASSYTTPDFVDQGTAPQTFGPTVIQVTTYTAAHLPLTTTNCDSSETISAFELGVGPVPGTPVALVTHIYIAETSQTPSGSSSSSVTVNVTSVTVA